jgi:RNA polymerase sigma-70 factor, ECF subfamily
LFDPQSPPTSDAAGLQAASVTESTPAGPRDGVRAAGGAGGAGPEDGALVRAAQGGDVAAFGRLYERYFDGIYGYLAYHLGGPDLAEDATAQVFLRALESLPRYRWTGAPFRAWLYRIAHNLVVDLHRRRTRHPVGVLDDEQVDPGRLGDPDGWLQEKVAREALLAAVDDLTALQRQVILLKFAAGLSNAEVAVVLERTEGAVKALQHAGLQSLQRRLAGSRSS